MDYPIAALGGCRGDLSAVSSEKHNIRLVYIMSVEFKKFLERFSVEDQLDENLEEIRSGANEKHSAGQNIDHDKWWMVLPLNYEKPISEVIIHEFVLALIIAYPSDAYLRAVYHTHLINGELHLGGTSHYEKQNRYFITLTDQDHFRPEGFEIPELNGFITLFLDYTKKNRDINRAIQFYQSSFQINDDLMSFLAMIIALEVIVPGKEQVTFRFRRSLGILIGRDRANAERIMKNASLLYDYRSSLVHGSEIKGSEATFDVYYRYARDLSARMIIEMLAHDFESISELDGAINMSGAGAFVNRVGYVNYFSKNTTWQNFYAQDLIKPK